MMRRVRRWLLYVLFAALLLLGAAVLLLTLLVDPESTAADLPQRVEISELSRFAEVPFPGMGGVTLHYLDSGPDQTGGPVFVMLHGFTLNAFSWHAQLTSLAQYGRVIALDQLPYGLSDKPIRGDWSGKSPYDRLSAVRLVTGLFDQLDLSRVILIGNSSGGTLAAELALAEPDRIAGVVLVAPWIYIQRPVLPAWLADSLPLQRLGLLAARKLGLGMPLLEASFHDPAKITEMRRSTALVHAQTRHWDLAWAELLNQSVRTRIRVAEEIHRLRHPVLVISGDDDRLVPVEDSRRVADDLPNALFRLLPGCGHAAHEECPEAFDTAIRQWLDDQALIDRTWFG